MSTESHNRIEEAAGDWFAKRESGEWSASDQGAFDNWLAESPLHRVAYLRIEHVWERAERLRALRNASGEVPPPGKWVRSPFDPSVLPPDDPQGGETEDSGSGATDWTPASVYTEAQRAEAQRASARGRSRLRIVGLAASLLILACLVVMSRLKDHGDHYQTPVGGLESVPMADGSRVTLNTDSALRVNLTPKERGVELERGEAFFEVAHDPSRPFVVSAGDKRVIAVGTQFSVRRDGDDVQVVVAEGTVRIEDRGARARGAPGRSSSPVAGPAGGVVEGSAEVVTLSAGSVAHASDVDVLVQAESPAEAEQALSWRQGMLVFHDMTLADAAAEFNRYNARQIVIEDPAVAGLRVAGNFRATNVDAFVRLLEHGYPLRVEQGESQVVIKAR